MANLGMLGMAKGLGDGMSGLGERWLDDERYEERSSIDEARAVRLETILQKGRVELNDADNLQSGLNNAASNEQSGLNAQLSADTSTQNNIRTTNTSMRNADESNLLTESEGEKNRTSREKVASLGSARTRSSTKVQFILNDETNQQEAYVTNDDTGLALKEESGALWAISPTDEQTATKEKYINMPAYRKGANKRFKVALETFETPADRQNFAEEWAERYGYIPKRYLNLLTTVKGQ